MRENELKLVEDFIYNDKVQNLLSDINNSVMDFNILKITGMGNQEIKHSNILGWLFDDSEHNLEYQVLDGFLKDIIKENPSIDKNDKLKAYLYLSNKKRDITIYREKDNIDLLIVDESNKIIITIENKIYASERTDGEDDGQLQKYENIINKTYNDTYDKHFIFLTIDLEQPSKNNWLKAKHQMITNVIENILQTKETTTKTKIILESYVDLLKRSGIVADEKLKKLCEKIWSNREHEEALDILSRYRVTQIKRIFDAFKVTKIYKNMYDLELEGTKKLYEKFDLDEDKQIFEVQVTYTDRTDTIWLGYFYPNLGEQEDKVQEICKKIMGKRNKDSVKILEINKKYVGNKDTETVVKEIQNEIKKIDEKIIKELETV